mmetsp:Transcript_9759/g.23877  ORF Transcript_9759/g.23877 Transcript_9759/m.23877 type:complete len:122 (-) Transcript_9759:2996-3361(-)
MWDATTLKATSLFLERNLQLSQDTHEAKVRKNPTESNSKAEKRAKLGKELELTEEEWNTCNHTCDHSIEDTDSQVTKCFGDSFIGIATSNLVSMRQVHDIINAESGDDSNEDALNTSQIPT